MNSLPTLGGLAGRWLRPFPVLFAGLFLLPAGLTTAGAAQDGVSGPVSYFRDVRPIFQANCQGCHQPSKAKGGYVMTDFKKLLSGGDKDGAAVVPGDASKGSLLSQITPENGAAEMPKNKPPLHELQLALIRRWIAEGAKDDTPADALAHYDAAHPPVYPRLPVVPSIDYSADGQLIAVAGFHEVLLQKADGSGVAGRLIGLSQRIQSVRFSPDGQWLAAVGGDPARLGEVQVWEVATRKLKLSLPVGWDTLNGVSWSPDSQFLAFGAADNTVRVIEAQSGKQLLQMGSHNDWPLETVFSLKGDHVVSVARDMTVKLSEVPAQRFVDNVTSITPGALRGGIDSVDRHPSSDVVAVGGADGQPQLFQIFRTAPRKIGDNANLVKKYEPMLGRVSVVRFSKDGSKLAAASALDGAGELALFSVGKDFVGSQRIQTLRAKPGKDRTGPEAAELQVFEDQFGKREVDAKLSASIYALAFHPDGQSVAVAGSDGKIRVYDAASLQVRNEFGAAPLQQDAKPRTGRTIARATPDLAVAEGEVLPSADQVTGLEVTPAVVEIGRPNDYVQLLITAKLSTGETADVTRAAKIDQGGGLLKLAARGLARPVRDGKGELSVSFAGRTVKVPVSVAGASQPVQADFIRDVNPAMTKLGCNAGACHGSKDGKAGFKLSLRGYDPIFDVRSLADERAARRINPSSPDDSLMLLKAVAEVPHEGGRRCETGDLSYQILRQWVASGARLDLKAARVSRIEVQPLNPVIGQTGSRQQMRVVATYPDGSARDVTAEAFLETGNADVASVDAAGLVQTLRRGEAPMLVRFEGNYAATTVTVMGDRKGFEWQTPPAWGRIDELVAAKWQRMKIAPSDVCTDGEFLRRVSLDLTGLPPSSDKLRAFIADKRPVQEKRAAVVDELIGSPAFVEHWTNKWADLLQVNPKFLGAGAASFRTWIRGQVEKNTPYDQFVQAILTAEGSNFENPAASYWKILRLPAEAMENTTHLFLATRFNCNKCHDHPFERWTQDQYYQTAAYFAQFNLAEDGANGKGQRIGGTAVEGAKPLYEKVVENPKGEMKHDRTGAVTEPKFPFPAKAAVDGAAPRRKQMSAWLTSPDNRYFAASYANRMWGYLLGRGLIEPLDDIRAGNPPSNPELLEHLTQTFVQSGFNVRTLLRTICTSRTYQLAIQTNRWNEDDTVNYSHAVARRLPAETLFDAVFKVTGADSALKDGRATGLVDSAGDVSTFLATLGKPVRESACECERSNDLGLGSVMALLSGPTVSNAIQNPKNALAKLTTEEKDDARLISELFQRVLSREATPKEVDATRKLLTQVDVDQQKVAASLEAKEKEQAPIIARMEKERLEAIAGAEKNLAGYEATTKFYRDEREKARKEREAAAVAALKGWDAAQDARVAGFLASTHPEKEALRWTQLTPMEAKTVGGQAKLAIEKDGSVTSTGGLQATTYELSIETGLAQISGILLEVLPDAAEAEFGPGRAKNGNFILTEFTASVGKMGNPAETAARFKAAWADFSQDKFPVAAAVDAKEDENTNGWAVSPQFSRRHLAAFQFEQPVAGGEKTRLKLRLIQKSSNNLVGRFRVYATTAADPLGAGVPALVAEAAAVEASARTAPQKEALAAHVRVSDPEYWRLRVDEARAKTPLTADPAHVGLQETLAKAKEPIHLDPALVQLREDGAASKAQAANKRLTVVQDLTWALINNPAFLFNR